jgi:hypothetical protein
MSAVALAFTQTAFLDNCRQIGFYRQSAGNYHLFSVWKADFLKTFPNATPVEIAQAMTVIADAAGV